MLSRACLKQTTSDVIVVAKPLSILFEKLCLSDKVPDD